MEELWKGVTVNLDLGLGYATCPLETRGTLEAGLEDLPPGERLSQALV